MLSARKERDTTTDTRQNKLEQLTDLFKLLHEVAAEEVPSPVRWAELKVELEENAVFGELFILSKITIEPRYSGGVTRIATFEVPERPEALTEGEPQVGVPFLASNGASQK